MTDKVQKIRNEVARIQLYTQSEVLKQVLDYIDEVQEEPVSEDLEGAAKEYVTKEGYLAGLHYNSMVRSFKAGAEWHASHNTKKLPDNLLLAARKASIAMCNYDDKYLDEYPYEPIAEQKFIEGAKWQKEQMMKDAVALETEIFLEGGTTLQFKNGEIFLPDNNPKTSKFKAGDKVKLIIIKEG